MYKSKACAFSAELFGTFVLVFVGLGAAILAGSHVGYLGVALAFGLALTVMTYSLGAASGAHLNPAVSFGMLFAGRISCMQFASYAVAQLLGAGIAAYAIYLIASGSSDFPGIENFASNGYGISSPGKYNMYSSFLVEAIGTGILTFVALCTQSHRFPKGLGGIALGLTLTAVLIVAIPVTNGGINPARSFASAIIQHGEAMKQLGFFFIAPSFGAIIIGIMSRSCMRTECQEECNDSRSCEWDACKPVAVKKSPTKKKAVARKTISKK